MRLLRRAAAGLLACCAVALPCAGAPPQLTPLPAPAPVNSAVAELGRHLFFEARLSGDGSRSCASCHAPARGYADGRALSRGYNGTEHFRNAPGLLSVRLRVRLMWDGRRDGNDLPGVVREMLTEAHFMNGDLRIIEERIRQIPRLAALWRTAYGERSAPQAAQVPAALAEYLKTLDAGRTAVDAALLGDPGALSQRAAEGLRLFTGKAGCVQCHHGPLLSDGRLHRLGMPHHPGLVREPLRTVTLLHYYALQGLPNPMAERSDVGAYAVSRLPADRGRFLTPGLRALAHTGPYMHNGLFASLEEVVAFYDRGGGPGGELRPLNLSARERQALVAFLQALSAPLTEAAEPEPYDYGAVAANRGTP